MNKIIFALAIALSTAAFAETPSDETASVARALVASPDAVLKLKKNNITFLSDVKIESVERGVTKFSLKFFRGACECIPASADVTIVEDVRPTFLDAQPLYSATVEITEKK